jgi:hypothetical protein
MTMTTTTEQHHPIWDRKLTEFDKAQIEQMMSMNPAIDYMLAETIVLMPPERFKEICEHHKANPREAEPARVLTDAEQHTGRVFTDEEQKEAEDAIKKADQKRNELYDKMEAEKEKE